MPNEGSSLRVTLYRETGEVDPEQEILGQHLSHDGALEILRQLKLADAGAQKRYWWAFAVREVGGQIVMAADRFSAMPEGTVIKGTTCPVCREWVGAGTADSRTQIDCRFCGSRVTVPPPDLEQGTDEYWRRNYGDPVSWLDNQFLSQRVREARSRLKRLVDFLPPPAKLLEVGSGTGAFLQEAKALGYVVTGLEPSQSAAITAASALPDIELLTCRLEDLEVQSRTWDVIAIFHVLEHVEDPLRLLVHAYQVLNAGGLLILEVPNGGARDARLDGIKWSHAVVDEHFFLPTAQALVRLAEEAGFSAIQTRAATMRSYDLPSFWFRRRVSWTLRGRLRASRDLLELVAWRPHRLP